MALSKIKDSANNQEYKDFASFVRDCALIWHNAYTYNKPSSGAYQDASTLKKVMEEQFQNLVEQKIVSEEDVKWPFLGDIPPVEDVPEDEDDDEEDDEDDDDEEEEDSDDGVKKRGRGRPPLDPSKRDSIAKGEGQKPDLKKKRGRPPKVDTPMEARIKNVLKGLRKHKDSDGNIMVINFEKLPDKSVMPEYYQEIAQPISIEQIKVCLRPLFGQ